MSGVRARREATALLVTFGLLGGCAGSGKATRTSRVPIPSPSETGTPDCFYVRDAQNFLVLDRSNLIIYAPNDNHAYHLRISPPSTELRWAEGLAFSPSDRICGYAGDRLFVGPPQSVERYAVIDVARLSAEGLEALRATARGDAAPIARPQPGAGAEVEPRRATPDTVDGDRQQ
ncbi:MAG: DUF6491 family protein [Gammaproteobacteria bacterium]